MIVPAWSWLFLVSSWHPVVLCRPVGRLDSHGWSLSPHVTALSVHAINVHGVDSLISARPRRLQNLEYLAQQETQSK